MDGRVTTNDMTNGMAVARLYELSIDMIATANLQGSLIDVNPAWLATLGWTPDEVTTRPYIEFVHPDDREATIAQVSRLVDGLSLSVTFENRYRAKNGAYHWLLWSAHADTTLGVIYCLAKDITLRREAEESLRDLTATLEHRVLSRTAALAAANAELEARDALFGGLLEAAPDAMVIIDGSTGRIVRVNAQTEQLFGYPRTELIGEAVELLIPQDVLGRVGHHESAATDARVRLMGAGAQLRAYRKDGTAFPVEISLSPLTTDGARLVSAAVRDISARVAIETELRLHRERLEDLVEERTASLLQMNEELESFSYSVSHDLRAPLRSLDGFSQALLEDHASQLDDQMRDYLARIRRAAQRMAAMLDGLLTLSRVTRGDIGDEPVDLSALAADVIEQLRHTDRERLVRVLIAPRLTCRGDANLLRVVLQNLIGNAWKFTGGTEDAAIEIGETRVDGEPAWFVRDNGAGFDPTYADRLFGAFQRLHREEQFPGTGIGLATVQRVVRRHGGSIAATGVPGRGATFTFTLASHEVGATPLRP